MKQVLVSVVSGHRVPRPLPPIVLWMSDDTQLGDTFLWGKRVLTVDAVYGTHLCNGFCQPTERPRSHRQPGVILDDHPS